MSEHVQILNLWLNFFGLLVTALVGLATAWIAYRMAKLKSQVGTLVEQTDGMQEQLLRVTGKEAFARGVQSEKDSGRPSS